MAKEPDALIDLKVLKADAGSLLTEHAIDGLTVDEAHGLLARREQYAGFPPDYARECIALVFAMLVREGRVAREETRKGERYRPAQPAEG
jgi:hypothetical protein